MVTLSNSLPRNHGLSLCSPQSSSIGFRTFRRSYAAASSSAFANENRESVSDLIFLCLFDFEFEFEFDDVSQILVFGEGLWSLEVAMPQAMQLGLSSNMTWPMDASVLCLKRSVYLFLAFANLVCLVTNHYVLNYHISKKLKLIGSKDQTEFNQWGKLRLLQINCATVTTNFTMCRLLKCKTKQNKNDYEVYLLHYSFLLSCQFVSFMY